MSGLRVNERVDTILCDIEGIGFIFKEFEKFATLLHHH